MEKSMVEKRQQDKCHQSFRQILNLLNLADTTLDGLCEKCSELPDIKRMISKALDQVLTVSGPGVRGEVRNRPGYLCVFYEHKERPVLIGEIFRFSPEGVVTAASDVEIDKASCTSLHLTEEDIFAINAPKDARSFQAFQQRFHPVIRERIAEPLMNCVGYHIHGETLGMIIGFNYPGEVTRYDGEVMKSLAVTVSSLATLAQQITEIKQGFIYLIEALTRASESNDEDTGNHIVRINTYAKHLSMLMGLSETFCNEIGLVAQMHDVGKIHTPSDILKKPGPLTPEESAVMKQHTLQGEIILGSAARLSMARNIAGAHHENYDGAGYPRGLKGDEIPMEAQIVKLVDVYDALRSPRPYKAALSHEEALRMIFSSNERVKPSHFNPAALELLHKEDASFARIYKNLK